MRRAVTSLPLHYGKAPGWLFSKMKRLAAAIVEIIVIEEGAEEFLARMADPVWFQAFGCALGFDWHSSGVTTTVCGAVKEAVLTLGDDFPVGICGGKAKRAIGTPGELEGYGERWDMNVSNLVAMSRLCAKIDSAAVQDGYNLYHHTFFFTRGGNWSIVQQGMSEKTRMARRYQWLSRKDLDVTSDPHTGISCDVTGEVLNFVAGQSRPAQQAVVDFARQLPEAMAKTWNEVALSLPERHYIIPADVNQTPLRKAFTALHESAPENFRDVMQIKGVGPKTISALALISELVYDRPPSFDDPARFSFAHGGKDGIPFPVDRKTYEKSIEFLKACLDRAKVGDKDKLDAFKKLSKHQHTW